MLPEGEALVAVLSFRDEAGDNWDRPDFGAVVGLVLREDTLA